MSTTNTYYGKPYPHKSHLYLAGLVLSGSMIPMPIVATIFTAAIFIAQFPILSLPPLTAWIAPNWLAIVTGFVITLVFWLLLALFFRNFTSIDSANPVSAGHLRRHFLTLQAGFDALNALNDNSKALLARSQLKAYLEEIENILDRKDTCWVAGTGYIQAWLLIHRAEETMIMLEPREEVINEAIYDEMCLTGSGIPARASALNKLQRAVKNLSASATQYLDYTDNQDKQNVPLNSKSLNSTVYNETSLVVAKNLGSPTTGEIAKTTDEKNLATDGIPIVPAQSPGVATTNGTPKVANEVSGDAPASTSSILTSQVSASVATSERPAAHVNTEMEARNALRDVRRTINEYRDHLWEGLVTGRNLLMGTALITGLLTYVLFCFAIIAGASPVIITAATAFYLVGALLGLFNRLYDESKVNIASNDYNVTLARIIVTPVLSGIAGVLGVLLTAMLSITLLKSALPQNANLSSVAPPLGLEDSFNLQRNSLGILIAAAFSLTPNLLINTLKKKANDFTDQLRNTGASEQATPSDQSKSGN